MVSLGLFPSDHYLNDVIIIAVISAIVATLFSFRFYLRITSGRCFNEVTFLLNIKICKVGLHRFSIETSYSIMGLLSDIMIKTSLVYLTSKICGLSSNKAMKAGHLYCFSNISEFSQILFLFVKKIHIDMPLNTSSVFHFLSTIGHRTFALEKIMNYNTSI